MSALPSFPIGSSAPLGVEVRKFGIHTFGELAARVRDLPYGRPVSTSPIAVLVENVGTCSSKHRLLAAIAQESGHAELQLVVGIYEMSEANTPGVGEVLAAHGVASMPEAHCYLVAGGTRFDLTGLAAGISSPFEFLLEEHFVEPKSLAASKDRWHKQAVKVWARQNGMASESAWQLREACIAALASNHSI